MSGRNNRPQGPSAMSPDWDQVDTFTAAHLERVCQSAPAHMRPIWWAAMYGRCALLIVTQGAILEDLPPRLQPLITYVGDDTSRADGPAGFPQGAIRELIRTSDVGPVVSSAPVVKAYRQAASAAIIHRRNVIIIETRPEQEIAWINFILEARPDMRLLVCTVEAGRA